MDPNEALERMRAAVRWELDRDGTRPAHEIIENAGEMADAFEALDDWLTRDGFPPAAWVSDTRLPVLGQAEPEPADPRICRSCGTPSAECDAIYARTEMTTGDLCCRACEVGDTSELHDPTLPMLTAEEIAEIIDPDNETITKEDDRNDALAEATEEGETDGDAT